MKALTLWEPWASLVAQGCKRIETRSWQTPYRGALYIHASLRRMDARAPHTQALLALLPDPRPQYGHILCRCTLADCVPMDEAFLAAIHMDAQEHLCGIYAPGRYAWLLEDVRRLDAPLPAKGRLGLWTPPVGVLP